MIIVNAVEFNPGDVDIPNGDRAFILNKPIERIAIRAIFDTLDIKRIKVVANLASSLLLFHCLR